MSKLLHLGIELPEIVRAVTSTPARAIQMQDQVGTLRPGAAADIAVFRVEEGEFSMTDTHGESRATKRKLKHILTIADGEPLPHDIPDRPAPYLTNLTIKDTSIRGTQGLIDAHRHGLYAQAAAKVRFTRRS